jgi:hypothetical protein
MSSTLTDSPALDVRETIEAFAAMTQARQIFEAIQRLYEQASDNLVAIDELLGLVGEPAYAALVVLREDCGYAGSMADTAQLRREIVEASDPKFELRIAGEAAFELLRRTDEQLSCLRARLDNQVRSDG